MRLALWLHNCLIIGVALVVSSIPGWAACVPYCNVGAEATAPPTYTAAFDGDVVGYFYAYEAHDLSLIRFWDVTTGYKSNWALPNLLTPTAAKVDFGAVKQGDKLVFEMWAAIQNNTQPGAGYIYNSGDPKSNRDGRTHFYSTQFMGGDVNGKLVPPGIFMGGEDLPSPYTDWDYNDLEFVFQVVRPGSEGMIGVLVDGVSIDGSGSIDNVVTPEPASVQLMLLGAVGIGSVVRRRFLA